MALLAPALGAQAMAATSISDEGRSVSFDEQAMDGAHAIRVQDRQGHILRELTLADFLPAAYVRVLPRGESGLRWLRGATLDRAQHRVDFKVAAPAGDAALAFSIDLRDGRVRTAQIREYLAAANAARELESATPIARR